MCTPNCTVRSFTEVRRIRPKFASVGSDTGSPNCGWFEPIEEIRANAKPPLVRAGKLKVLLEREVDLVDAGVPDIREIAWRVPEHGGAIHRGVAVRIA
jgi:hypothetical protein